MFEFGGLPPDLRAPAIPFGAEVAWPRPVARAVIEFLGGAGIAVIGVEIWLPEASGPRVWGWSDYEVPFTGDWGHFVQGNADRALAEIAGELPEDALINLTCVDHENFITSASLEA